MNINNGVKRWEVTAFVRTCWTKTETVKGSNKRKSFVEPEGKNGSNFKMRHFSSITINYHQKWWSSLPPEMGEMAQTFISEIEWLAVLKCRATGLSTSLFVPSHPFLLVMITIKVNWQEKLLIFKIGTIHLPFIVQSIFVQHVRTKALRWPFTFSIHFAPSPLIDFKNSKPIFAFYYAYYAFVVSLTWLAYFLSHDNLSHKFTRFFKFIFCLSLTKGQRSKR